MPPLGKYLPHNSPEDAMVIDFGIKNRVVALCDGFLRLAFKMYKMGTLLSSLKKQAA
jgi:hypothetical protein